MGDDREIDLLPCPFCGSVKLEVSDELDEDANWVVWCSDCKGGSTFCEHRAEAITHWNTRAPFAAALLAKREVKPLPCYLECAMCCADESFVISKQDPSTGYCFAEKREWTLAAQNTGWGQSATPDASNELCLNCGKQIAELVTGPPINDTTWYHLESDLVWCAAAAIRKERKSE